MNSIDKKLSILFMLIIVIIMTSACNSSTYAPTDTIILSADNLQNYIGQENVIIVDMQSMNDYSKQHVEGAVNITKNDIVINDPVDNMLAPADTIEKVLGQNGISNDTTVIVYDSDKMSASRMLWTLFMYGHENVKVVDGGINAIKAEGIELTTKAVAPTATTFTASINNAWLASLQDVRNQVYSPKENVILLDVRTDEEYKQLGTIPTSCRIDFVTNFYSDGTFKNTQTTQINYLDANVLPENEIIIYCQTSMRASSVFVSLYNAGYRNIKIYDGAFLEWSSNPNNPIDLPSAEEVIAPSGNDAS